MRSLLTVSGSVLCVLAMAACALDSAPESGDDPATMSADSSELVTVPPELSLDGPNQQSCHVTLLSCREQGIHPPAASACFIGNCRGNEAQVQARALCEEACQQSNVVCRNIVITRC